MKPGFYSLIQFCPDATRAEGVNVGVVVGALGASPCIKLAGQNEQVKKRFGKDSFDEVRLEVEKRGLARRLAELSLQEMSELARFISLEAGRLVVLEPRPLMVTSTAEDAERLFVRLVDDPAPVRRSRGKAPKLDRFFEPLVSEKLVQRSVTVDIPLMGKSLHTDYAYRNGRQNFIKAHAFSADLDSAFASVSDIGSKGLLLAKHPGELESRLILVSDIEDTNSRTLIEAMLKDHQVRSVDIRDIDELVDEVRREAH